MPLQTTKAGLAMTLASVDGRSGLFLFDSGIGTSGITPETADRIGCRPWGKVTGFRAIGERVDLSRCNTTQIAIGVMHVTMPQMVVIDLKKFMGPTGRQFSGILGLDIFAGQTITLDVAGNRIIRESRQSLAAIRQSEIEVPIRLVRAAEGAALTVDLGIPTSSGMLWMEIDTGNYGSSLVDKRAAPLVGLDRDNAARQDWHVVPRPGLEASGPAVVRDLILDGDLGRDVLRRWLVTLDLKNGRGWIRQAAQ